MIALQARNPQLPDPARATAQMANMMNMASQQRAAQLQGQRTRQEMDYAEAREGREVETQTSAQKKAGLEYLKDLTLFYRDRLARINPADKARYGALREKIITDIPAFDAELPFADEWNQESKTLTISKADDVIKYSLATPVASLELGVDNKPRSVVVGGLPGAAEQRPVLDAVDSFNPTPAPRATPTTPPASAMERGPSATSGAPMTFGTDAERPLNAYQQEDLRNLEGELGMTDTPASFTGGMGGAGQMTPDVMSRIVDSAFKTGVMAQVDFDQLLASQAPQNKQALMNAFQQANITLQADAPSLAGSGMGQQQMAANPVQRPQSQFADMRGPAPQSQTAGLRGAPPMEQTLAQTRTSTPLQMRNPNQPIAPGSSVVPLGRLKAEADVRRETPEQIKIRKAAELQATEDFEEANKDARLGRKREEVFEGERAKKDAAFLDTYSDATTKSRTTLNVIDQMIGDARIEKDRLVVPKGGRRPHPGFEGVVGMGVPGVRLFPGTAAAGFDALFEQAEGGAFLQAYESLRGTGQITEIEGTKATSALTRMKRSQSEAEFVKAAREFADVLRAGVARADKRYTRLTGETPAAAPTQRKTPTKSTLSPATRAKYGL